MVKRQRFLFLISAICIVALSCSLLIAPLSAQADAGGFSGSSDFGGGDWGSSWDNDDWGSSWDDDDDWGSSWSWDDDDDFWGSSGSSSSYHSGGGIGFPFAIFVVIVAFVFIVAIRRFARASMGGSQPAGAQRTDTSLLNPIAELQQQDPAFSPAEVQEKISNIYVQLQNNWTAKDLEPMRPYLDDKLYATFDRQLDAYRNAGRTNRVDNISVLGVNLDGWYQTDQNDCLVATVRTRIVDYDVDDHTGNILSGSATAEKFMTYEYTLIRTKGATTRVQTEESEAVTCPNCGAPLNINRTSRCPYCDSIVTLDTFDWVVSQIKGLSQQTVGR